MKTIIAGTRTATKAQTFAAILAAEREGFIISEVVSGGNKLRNYETGEITGADYWGEAWAKERYLPVKKFRAAWAAYGLSAGPIRNRQMAKYADALIAVWDGESKGTANMIEEARRLGLRVFVYRIDKEGKPDGSL